MLLTSKVWQISFPLGLWCAVIAGISLWPLLRWFSRGGSYLPMVEVYCAMHIPGVVIPLLTIQLNVYEFPAATLERVCLIISAYLIIVQATASVVVTSCRRNGGWRAAFLDRQLPVTAESFLAWTLLAVWWIGTALIFLRLFPEVGGAFQFISTTLQMMGKISLFLLFYRLGSGRLPHAARWVLFLALFSQLLMDFGSGFLVGGTTTLLLVLMAYAIAARRIPVIAGAVVFLVLSFLHAGKSEVRSRYWAEGANYSVYRLNPMEVYRVWLSASWKAVLAQDKEARTAGQSFLTRAGVVQCVARVVAETPENLPYLKGETYLMTPPMFIPRVFWPDKPRASAPTERLAIYYGVQTEEGADVTAIGMGQIAEAWSNFGWMGVLAVGGVMGLLLSLPFRMGYRRAPVSIGFLLGLPFLTLAFGLENCLGPTIHALTLHLVALGLVLYSVTRPAARLRTEPRANQTKPPGVRTNSTRSLRPL